MSSLVLLVGIEPAVEEQLAKVLGPAELERCAGAEELIERAGRQQPHLVCLYNDPPRHDAYELCERLRVEEGTNLVPVLFIDARASRERLSGFRIAPNAVVRHDTLPEALPAALEQLEAWRRSIKESGIRSELRFELASQSDVLVEVLDLIRSLLLLTPLGERATSQTRRAALEMGLNAIEWGNEHDPDKIVSIVYQRLADCVRVTVTDEGEGFDPNNLPHAAKEDDPISHIAVRELLGMREGGYGILLARGLVDELNYSEKANEVTIVKRFPQPS